MTEFIVKIEPDKIPNPEVTNDTEIDWGENPSSVVLGALMKYGEAVVSVSRDYQGTEVFYYNRHGGCLGVM